MTDTRLSQRGFLWAAAILLACLAPHVTRFPWWLSLGLVCLVLLRLLQRQRMGVAVPKPIRLALVLALTLLIGWHYGSLVGRHAGSALLATMLVLKLMESERRRDARLVVVFSVFVLLTQFLFSETLLLTAYVGLCVILIFSGLREFTEPRDDPQGWRGQATLAWRDRLRPVLVTALLALPLTIFLFLLFPRLGSPLWGAPLDPLAGRTGVSDSMSPGDISILLADDSPAFRVSFLDGRMPPSDQRFWRGPVLWRFDGHTWNRVNYLFDNIEAAEVEPRGPLLRYEMTMEPTEQPWVMALDVPLSAPEGLRLSADQVMRSRRPLNRVQRYELVSATAYRMEPELRITWRNMALDLPDNFNPRSIALGRQWRAEHAGDDRAIIERALRMFNETFIYSLAPPLLGRHSMDDFLFSTREGYCEHYASAFAVLMRAAGIPTRVVTGYLGGRYIGLGDYWLVLQSDAHAWNEVWLEGEGWVRVDPTAAVAPERVFSDRGAATRAGGGEASRSWWRGIGDVGDWIGHRWISAVLEFNALRQREVLRPFGVPDATWRDLGLALVLVFSVLSVAWLALALRGTRPAHDPLRSLWRLLGRRLAAVGVARRHNEGPEDWLARACKALPQEAARLDDFRRRFIALRYATMTAEAESVAELHRDVRRYRPRRPAALQRPVQTT
jgi:protein-glutamine gamma-glutamyltransferase